MDLTVRICNSLLYDGIRVRTPANRREQPEEIAGASAFLATRASNFSSGVRLAVASDCSVR